MGKILDINDLYLMAAISGEPTLSAVAARLNVTRSAVTKRVQKIESIIGKPLLSPTGALELTEPGQLFLELSRHTLGKYEEFLIKVGNIKTGHQLIRIMGNAMVMSFDIPSAANKLREVFPDTEIDIYSGSAEETIKSIINGEIDIGIVPDNPQVTGLMFYRYKKEKICVLANKQHPAAENESLGLHDISTLKLIGTGKNRVVTSIVNAAAQKANLKLTYINHADDYYLQGSMIAESNTGIGITYDQIASKWESMGNVVKIPINEPWAVRNFFIVTQRYEKSPPQIEAFIHFILDAANKTKS